MARVSGWAGPIAAGAGLGWRAAGRWAGSRMGGGCSWGACREAPAGAAHSCALWHQQSSPVLPCLYRRKGKPAGHHLRPVRYSRRCAAPAKPPSRWQHPPAPAAEQAKPGKPSQLGARRLLVCPCRRGARAGTTGGRNSISCQGFATLIPPASAAALPLVLCLHMPAVPGPGRAEPTPCCSWFWSRAPRDRPRRSLVWLLQES